MSDRLALANAIEDAGIERAKAERVPRSSSTSCTIALPPRPTCRRSVANCARTLRPVRRPFARSYRPARRPCGAS